MMLTSDYNHKPNFDPIRKSEVFGGNGGVESSFDAGFDGGSSGEGR